MNDVVNVLPKMAINIKLDMYLHGVDHIVTIFVDNYYILDTIHKNRTAVLNDEQILYKSSGTCVRNGLELTCMCLHMYIIRLYVGNERIFDANSLTVHGGELQFHDFLPLFI